MTTDINDVILNEDDVRERIRLAEEDEAHEVVEVWEQVQDVLLASLDELSSHGHDDCVHNESNVTVYRDASRHVLGDVLDEIGVEDDVMRDYINELMHDLARDVCDYDWSAVDPLVIVKAASRELLLGERHVEDRLVDLIERSGGSAAAALDYYMTQERGYSQSQWAEIRDVSQQDVSHNSGNVDKR